MKRASSLVVSIAVVVVAGAGTLACTKDKSSEVTTSAAQPTGTTAAGGTTKPETSAAPSAAASAQTATTGGLGKPAVTFKEGLSTPESVLYDEEADEYVISNINGTPLTVDNNGYLMRVSPDGKVVAAKWIEGGKNKVTLNAPKGTAISGDKLFVSDIDTVRIFDKKTGAPAGEVKVPGATFVNDLATAPDGKVWVSDSGLKAGKDGFEPSGSDAIYVIDPKDKKLKTISKSKDLDRPNGLLALADKTWVVTFGSGQLFSIDANGKMAEPQKMPKPSCDGIVPLEGGELLVSSWDASGVFRGKAGGEFKQVLEGVKAPADIGWDKKRKRVLVPMFQDNEVRAYDVK